MTIRASLAAFLSLLLTVSMGADAASLTGAVQASVRSATYEVVMKKPEIDSLSYEKPLPMELLPFKERNDKYISIGSAFAIGENRFATAAHVLSRGFDTQFGQPALRGPDGVVHEIAQIHKYSQPQDFAVFSCATPVKGTKLGVNREPKLDTPVFAVGNALGEGIVIRDGLLTSFTPEERNGEWKWLRFSAAASPGNSGGPLLDLQGRVIGVVLRKSESENLNYALPIGELLDAKDNVGRLEMEMRYSMPVMDKAEAGKHSREIALPKSYAEMAGAANDFFQTLHSELARNVRTKNADQLFPRGPGSAALRYASFPVDTLAMIAMKEDGTWDAYVGENVQSAQLPDNGYVMTSDFVGSLLVKVRRPDSIPAEEFYTDSRAYMDALLKVWPWSRNIGREKIRITSFGKAKSGSEFVDEYGRKWQLRLWNVEHRDAVAISLALPTPEGYVGIVGWRSTAGQFDALTDFRAMTSFAYTTLAGSLQQWREYLQLKALWPRALEKVRVDFEYGKTLRVHAPRFAFSYDESQQRIAADSRLQLMFGYVPEGDAFVWDVTGLAAISDPAGNSAIAIARRTAPAASLPQAYSIDWNNLSNRQHPFNARIEEAAGVSTIATIHPYPGPATTAADAPVLYTMVWAKSGNHKEKAMQADLKRLSKQLQLAKN